MQKRHLQGSTAVHGSQGSRHQGATRLPAPGLEAVLPLNQPWTLQSRSQQPSSSGRLNVSNLQQPAPAPPGTTSVAERARIARSSAPANPAKRGRLGRGTSGPPGSSGPRNVGRDHARENEYRVSKASRSFRPLQPAPSALVAVRPEIHGAVMQQHITSERLRPTPLSKEWPSVSAAPPSAASRHRRNVVYRPQVQSLAGTSIHQRMNQGLVQRTSTDQGSLAIQGQVSGPAQSQDEPAREVHQADHPYRPRMMEDLENELFNSLNAFNHSWK